MFSQEYAIIPMCSAGQATATTGVEFESFNMKNYDHACVIFQFDIALSTSTGILTFECGSGDSTDSADLTFRYRVNSGSTGYGASCDVYGSWATASTITLNAHVGKTLLVEFDADDLPTASKQYQWVTASIAGTTAPSAGAIAAFAILSKARYAKDVMPTAI